MQDLGNDMENLLRRASDAYPVKPGEDKWDEIAARVKPKPGNHPGPGKKIWPLFLLCGIMLSYFELNKYRSDNDAMVSLPENQPAESTHLNYNYGQDNNLSKIYHERTNQAKNNNVTTQKKLPYQLSIKKTHQAPSQTALNPIKNTDLLITGNHDRLIMEPDYKINEKENNLWKDSLSRLIIVPRNIVTNIPAGKNETTDRKTFSRGGYYGLTGGIHMNAVKDQPFNQHGLNIGIVLGYRFNPALSLESGLLFENKYYWTSGKYFNTDKMSSSMPQGMEMTEVHGSSNILGIPLHLRYDIFRRPGSRFFSSAGFSSYIMTGENNQYHTMLNGTEGKMNGSYKQNRGYFAASADLSAGYEINFGKKAFIRIEPYIQLPLKGIGVGHLPVKSTGIRLGITRSAQ